MYVCRSIEHQTGDGAIWLCSTPIWSVVSHLSSLSTEFTIGLAVRRLFIVLPCRKATIHLQTSMPSPRFEPNPNGITVSVTNHYPVGQQIQLQVVYIQICT
ncbi:hypothetical protein TNCV_1089421 [Trichonephila clavipes]|uniref:Uncharacterized protein n=1 Tax=Trichonephila clavipes TaxID=2585209 RepID=A0A8X6SZG8_TRICX|nr:hypothetical protein TNCV_1089421 [Trichonephila clavipes]